MKDLALKAIEDLKRKHEPAFIILYGSVARGDYSDDSDIDIACFCESPRVAKDVRVFEGRKLDCWLYAIDEADPERTAFLRFVGGELFEDEGGQGRLFLDKVYSKYESGPEPVTEDSRQHLEEWSRHMLGRAAGSGLEANYRRVSLPCELLEIYFKLRNLWYRGPRNSFHWLKENDYTTYCLFEQSFSHPADMGVLARLVDATTDRQASLAIATSVERTGDVTRRL